MSLMAVGARVEFSTGPKNESNNGGGGGVAAGATSHVPALCGSQISEQEGQSLLQLVVTYCMLCSPIFCQCHCMLGR